MKSLPNKMDVLQFLTDMPYRAVSYYNELPQFDLLDYNLYGKPDNWGVYDYIILDNFEASRPFVTDWDFEQERRGALLPIHRYCRVARFESILKQLLCGSRIKIKDDEMLYVISVLYDPDPDNVWESVRSILKQNGWSKYYNRIPCILRSIGYKKKIIHPKWEVYQSIVEDFRNISWVFSNNVRYTLKRKYFMNFRFVAIKLMKRHGVVFEYKVPNLRTLKIEKELDVLLDEILEQVQESIFFSK